MTRTSLFQRPYPLLVGVLAAGAAGYLLWNGRAHSAKPAAPAPPPAAVLTTQVVPEDVPVYLIGIGTVQAAASVLIKPRVDGQLQSVAFKEGQDIKQGQVLAQIDPRPFAAQLAQAQAQRAKDEAQLANARLDLTRYQTLLAQDSTSQQTLATQRALVQQLAATVRNDQAQVEYAHIQLNYTTITAPLSGRAGVRLVDPGNIVHASDNTGLVLINQIDPITVLFTLPEDNFQNINRAIQASAGQPLPVTALAREDDSVLGVGQLLLINNQIDSATGTVQLKARFSNPAHTLWPGQYVNARLQLGVQHQALTVPTAAVQRNQNGTYVYRVQANNTVALQPVKVGLTQAGKAVIEQGLAAGNWVVVAGHYKLKPGARIVEQAKPGAAPP